MQSFVILEFCLCLCLCLNKDTVEPDPMVKVRGAWSYSSFEACCDALHFLEHRHILLCTHPPCRGQETCASTDLLRRLHGYMKQRNVDFIGGDFNMSAFSTVVDVFSDTEFSAPGNSFLWGLGALEEPNRERIGFLIMPKRPYYWRVDTISVKIIREKMRGADFFSSQYQSVMTVI